MAYTPTPYKYNNVYNGGLGNAEQMTNNQQSSYEDYLQNLPSYQANLQNQAFDQNADSYNQTKKDITKNANRRGLLYSGLKQGAEADAGVKAASNARNQIQQGNQQLSDYTTSLGNDVTRNVLGNYQGQVAESMGKYNQQQAKRAQEQGQLGSLAMGAAQIGAMALFSDKNLKDDVKPADKEANDMLKNMKATTWSYKDDPKKETRLGILAQDLEKSKMGKSLVVDTPKGKAVDMVKALSAVLAVQSALDKRLRKAGA